MHALTPAIAEAGRLASVADKNTSLTIALATR